MGGIEAIRELKKRAFSGIILGSTGNSLHDDFIEEGIHVVLRKPYTGTELKQAIAKAKALGSGSSSSSSSSSSGSGGDD